MKSIFKIAWRNIWRNRLRSMVVIGSIVLGIWAGVFVSGFSYGLNQQRIESSISNHFSHIQVHHPQWKAEKKLAYWLPQAEEVQNFISRAPEVETFTQRIRINGMIASAHFTAGVQISGVHPQKESLLTGLKAKVDSGNYLNEDIRNPVLIGAALAEKLKIKPGSKLVLTFTDEDGNIVSGAFKVTGFYDAISSQQEKSEVFVRSEDLLNLLEKQGGAHEIALLLKDPDQLESFKADIQEKFPEALVRSWKDLSPELSFADELMTMMLYIIIGIIMLALCFGIINTMMMAVLERRKELGMLMGVGMSKTRLFLMIIFETLLLALCGGPLGVLLGYVSIRITQYTGLDLSAYGEGLESIGIETVVYPSVDPDFYFGTTALVVGITLVAAIWPAQRALKLNPVETIRTI